MNEKKYKLELTVAEINLIAAGLGKLPLEQVFKLFQDIQLAIIEQDKEQKNEQN